MTIAIDRRGETKRPTNVSLDTGLVVLAKALGVNISQACEAGLRQQIALASAAAWRAENSAAMASSNDYVESRGLPLAAHRLS